MNIFLKLDKSKYFLYDIQMTQYARIRVKDQQREGVAAASEQSKQPLKTDFQTDVSAAVSGLLSPTVQYPLETNEKSIGKKIYKYRTPSCKNNCSNNSRTFICI